MGCGLFGVCVLAVVRVASCCLLIISGALYMFRSNREMAIYDSQSQIHCVFCEVLLESKGKGEQVLRRQRPRRMCVGLFLHYRALDRLFEECLSFQLRALNMRIVML